VEVIDGTTVKRYGIAPAGGVCVVVPPSASREVITAATWVGADAATAEQALASSHRRPVAQAAGRRISVIAFATAEDFTSQEVHLHVGRRGLVAVCPEPLMPVLREAVSRVRRGPEEAMLAVLLMLANQAAAAVQDLSAEANRLDQGSVGLAADAQRRTVSGLRHRLFALQQLWNAHHVMCTVDVTLADALSRAGRRRLRQSGVIFEASAAAAAQVYALLGDTLDRYSAVISERLTLVTVIFLPLTVSSGFFGMNFGWMTDHIGSAAAFAVLGIVAPLALVGLTVLTARRISRT
jgi:Mg2+ and Co2+ transporter CorA